MILKQYLKAYLQIKIYVVYYYKLQKICYIDNKMKINMTRFCIDYKCKVKRKKTLATHEYLAETMNKTVTFSCQITD